jgi:hypothetical protein
VVWWLSRYWSQAKDIYPVFTVIDLRPFIYKRISIACIVKRVSSGRAVCVKNFHFVELPFIEIKYTLFD